MGARGGRTHTAISITEQPLAALAQVPPAVEPVAHANPREAGSLVLRGMDRRGLVRAKKHGTRAAPAPGPGGTFSYIIGNLTYTRCLAVKQGVSFPGIGA